MLVLGWLAASAFAEPPRGEVVVGWAGNTGHGYGFLTMNKALVRGDDAHSSLVVKATVSELYYAWTDGGVLHRVESPGASIGPGFTYSTPQAAIGAGVGFEARRDAEWIGDAAEPVRSVELDASLSANLGWRPGAGTAMYGYATFSAVHRNLWARVGAVQQVVPLIERNTDVSLWIGPEVTTLGGIEAHLYELAGVVEVPIPDWNAAFSVRAGVSTQQLRGDAVRRPTGGAGVYWSF